MSLAECCDSLVNHLAVNRCLASLEKRFRLLLPAFFTVFVTILLLLVKN